MVDFVFANYRCILEGSEKGAGGGGAGGGGAGGGAEGGGGGGGAVFVSFSLAVKP